MTAFVIVCAACGGRSSHSTAIDAGQDGLAACQIDWLSARGDNRELRTFDDRGRFVHASWALNGGSIYMFDDFSYDDDRLLEGRYTRPTGEVREDDRNYYDDQHRVIRATSDGDYTGDSDADGRLDSDARCSYDASGHLSRIDWRDADGNPIADRYELVSWDSHGCMTLDDSFSPGQRDRATLSYRPGCVLARIDHDYGADGTTDASETWDFDDLGRVVRYHGLAGDERSYFYGDDGRLARIIYPDATEQFTYCAGTFAVREPSAPALPRTLSRRFDRDRW
jgi:hypothetical protein